MSAFEADRFNHSRTSPRRTEAVCIARSLGFALDVGSGFRRPLSASTFEADPSSQHGLSLKIMPRQDFNHSSTLRNRPIFLNSQIYFIRLRNSLALLFEALSGEIRFRLFYCKSQDEEDTFSGQIPIYICSASAKCVVASQDR